MKGAKDIVGMLDRIIDRVAVEQVEIELEINADEQRMTVRPYKPFAYACPYRAGSEDG